MKKKYDEKRIKISKKDLETYETFGWKVSKKNKELSAKERKRHVLICRCKSVENNQRMRRYEKEYFSLERRTRPSFWKGLIKFIFFALIIAYIACNIIYAIKAPTVKFKKLDFPQEDIMLFIGLVGYTIDLFGLLTRHLMPVTLSVVLDLIIVVGIYLAVANGNKKRKHNLKRRKEMVYMRATSEIQQIKQNYRMENLISYQTMLSKSDVVLP